VQIKNSMLLQDIADFNDPERLWEQPKWTDIYLTHSNLKLT
jgi:hypothetical protein